MGRDADYNSGNFNFGDTDIGNDKSYGPSFSDIQKIKETDATNTADLAKGNLLESIKAAWGGIKKGVQAGGIAGAITGLPELSFVGAVTGAVFGYNDNQVDQVAQKFMDATPGLEKDVATGLAKDVLDRASQNMTAATKGMSEQEASDYSTENKDSVYTDAIDSFSGGDTSIAGDGQTTATQGDDTGAYQYNQNKRQILEDYVNKFYGTAKDAFDKQAGQISDATAEQKNVLDPLISGLQEGNNLNPISYRAGPDTISYIPRSNRDTANQIADLGRGRLGNALVEAGAGNAQLNYLDALLPLINQEAGAIGVDKGIDISQQGLNQNEPGTLDKIKGWLSLGSSASDFLRTDGDKPGTLKGGKL